MGVLTKEMERRMLQWALVDPSDPNLPLVSPIMVRLMETNGTSTAPGVELVADSYEPVDASFGYSSEGSGATFINVTLVEFNIVDTVYSKTVVGVELWDSSEEPVRVGYAALDQPFIVAAGAPFSIAPGQLRVKLA